VGGEFAGRKENRPLLAGMRVAVAAGGTLPSRPIGTAAGNQIRTPTVLCGTTT
jgi:hypothetical protein